MLLMTVNDRLLCKFLLSLRMSVLQEAMVLMNRWSEIFLLHQVGIIVELLEDNKLSFI